MSQFVERTSFDLCFQSHRIRSQATEVRLLVSIAERGIEQPLVGVDTPGGRLLLDGFKRYRCAEKLGIEDLPYVCWGEDSTQGICRLMGANTQKALNTIEQARFVGELISNHSLSQADVASLLSRSKAWVSVRHGLLRQTSPNVVDLLFRGEFPVYSYMVTLRSFMRMNNVAICDIERFIQAVASQSLSVREIELLAHGYFRGTPGLRTAIDQGNWKWTLTQMQAVPRDPEGCSEIERSFLRELERLLQAMQRVSTRWDDERLHGGNFYAQVNLLLASLLGRRDSFFRQMEEFYDRSGQTSRHLSTASGGDVTTGD